MRHQTLTGSQVKAAFQDPNNPLAARGFAEPVEDAAGIVKVRVNQPESIAPVAFCICGFLHAMQEGRSLAPLPAYAIPRPDPRPDCRAL
ncbi:MAG: hypothetical protein KGN84_09265, partial [Acidobacteriota bacterium]|nr:hypothetical protein [Acidobacteriota bacterium]